MKKYTHGLLLAATLSSAFLRLYAGEAPATPQDKVDRVREMELKKQIASAIKIKASPAEVEKLKTSLHRLRARPENYMQEVELKMQEIELDVAHITRSTISREEALEGLKSLDSLLPRIHALLARVKGEEADSAPKSHN